MAIHHTTVLCVKANLITEIKLLYFWHIDRRIQFLPAQQSPFVLLEKMEIDDFYHFKKILWRGCLAMAGPSKDTFKLYPF